MREIKYQMETLNTDIACKPLNSAHFGGGVRCKTLLAAVLLGAAPVAYGAENVDLPTLDADSAYTLTRINVAEGEAAPSGDNIIVKYEYDTELEDFIPVYYEMKLSQTDYGYTDLDNADAHYYKFNLENINDKENPSVVVPGTSDDYDISYYANPDRLQTEPITDLSESLDADYVGVTSDNDSLVLHSYDNDNSYSITGDFVGNTAESIINNQSSLDKVKGNFIANSGIGIRNHHVINEISGNFIGNTDAIENSGVINSINANFINNGSGIINAMAQINSIKGDFIGNNSGVSNLMGIIGDIEGDFIANEQQISADTDLDMTSVGGVGISNLAGRIGNIKGNFINNNMNMIIPFNIDESDAALELILMKSSSLVSNNFISQSGDITGDFINNHSRSNIALFGSGGGVAVHNALFSGSGNISGNFINNSVTIEKGNAFGGAIENYMGYIGSVDPDTREIIYGEIKNSSFINNTAESINGNAYGGAIFSDSTLNITADNGVSVFSGNKTISGDTEESNAIAIYGLMVDLEKYTLPDDEEQEDNKLLEYLDDGYVFVKQKIAPEFSSTGGASEFLEYSLTNPAELNLKAVNNGVIRIDDKITGGAYNSPFMEALIAVDAGLELPLNT